MAVGIWLLWPRPSAITKENANRIQVGMTLQEVEAILGGPARDDTHGAGRAFFVFGTEGVNCDQVHRWIGAESSLWIAFDSGKVTQFERGGTIWLTLRDTFFERIRRRLRL
jgi:outer membrane protein assembly factor BamE (lipoprotein component of BamABCDE complex)